MATTTSTDYQESVQLTTRKRETKATVENIDPPGTSAALQDESLQWNTVTKSFLFASPILGFNWVISETTEHKCKPAYFASVSVFSWAKPAIILRSGHNSRGDILAVAYCGLYRPVHVGIGNPEVNQDHVSWETMCGTSWAVMLSSEYTFDLDIPLDDAESVTASSVEKRSFAWKKTSDPLDGAVGFKARVAWRNYKLVDKGTDQTLAIFLAKPLWSLQGTSDVQFLIRVPQKLETVAIVTMASILLKWRRRE